MRPNGDAIRDLRKKRRISLRLLADLVGCDFSYLGKVERGQIAKVAGDRLVQIASVLDVAPSLLVLGPIATPIAPTETGELPELDDNRIYSPDEAAVYTPYRPRTLREKAYRREIPHRNANGKRVQFTAADIREINEASAVPVYKHRRA
ncbi:helix-turn-helix transcriptional regulator [Streptomyces sp. NPDC046977]|uniref:helix-turn-helix domain-containing protein n=1 Tax=Streptomyces sp. NPDC046977 TaxID=3154703 RepID=UPI0033EE2F58